MKRKVFLVLLLTFALIFCFAACKSADKDGQNDSGNNNDHVHTGGTATCLSQAVCDECGESYGDRAAHDYKEATCSTAEVCKVCRHVGAPAVDHDYDAATCTEPAKCRFCGGKSGEALGHKCGNNPIYNDNSHWYACSVCTTKIGIESHSGGQATCTDLAVCATCGSTYGELAKHTGGQATCTNLAVCDSCGAGYGELENHNYTKATCTEASVCTECGDEAEGALDHNWKSYYSYDDNEHWYDCTRCDEEKERAEHTGGEATEFERARCEVCGNHYGEHIEITIDWQTEAVFPSVGETVVLANSDIYGWYQSYNFNTTNTDAFWLGEDIFHPIVPTFKWNVGAPAQYYKFYISRNSDMTSSTCYFVVDTEVKIEHLYVNSDYYWFVDAVYSTHTVRSEVFSFKTAPAPRTVNIEGVSNARDIGGYITLDGLRIKQGMVYRSAKLDDITELGKYTLVNILGVKTDLDLRGDKATKPVSELNHIATACPWYSTGSNHIWMNDTNKAEFANTVKVFADPDNYPIIFHCSLGRDRTGTLAMVLGGLLGLDENTLMMEYELSVFSFWGTNGGTKYETGLRKQIHDTYDYIDNNYDGDSFSEKVADFLLEIGVTAEEIASIKTIMLEEVN